jgi:hypothetical protein
MKRIAAPIISLSYLEISIIEQPGHNFELSEVTSSVKGSLPIDVLDGSIALSMFFEQLQRFGVAIGCSHDKGSIPPEVTHVDLAFGDQ